MTAPRAVTTPFRRDAVRSVEIRCRHCGWHIVTLRVVRGEAVLEAEKRQCPNCKRYTMQAVEIGEAA